MNHPRSQSVRSSSFLSFIVLTCVLLLSGCHRDIAGIEPGEVRVVAARWVDVEPGGSKSGIEVLSTDLLPTTTIRFDMPYAGYVTLSICDGINNPVARPINDTHLSAGIYEVNFNATGLASGVYIFTLVVRGGVAIPEGTAPPVIYSKSRKMMLLK
jgi:hypothetical protein